MRKTSPTLYTPTPKENPPPRNLTAFTTKTLKPAANKHFTTWKSWDEKHHADCSGRRKTGSMVTTYCFSSPLNVVLEAKQRGRHCEGKHEKSSLELNGLLHNLADNAGPGFFCASPALPDRGNRKTSGGFVVCLQKKDEKQGWWWSGAGRGGDGGGGGGGGR